MSWLETYRGTVNRWEVDNVDHFTVAFYFARLEDAIQALLHDLRLEAADGRTWVTTNCDVRYQRELRVGDILHFRSGVVGADDEGLRLVHEVIDSDDGTVCTTIEQTLVLVDRASRKLHALDTGQRQAALARRVEPPAADKQPLPPPPTSDLGFIDSTRDAIKPAEADALGDAALAAYIHRFSAANAHVLAAFGMTPEYCRRENRGLSTFEFRLRFLGSLRVGDLLLVRSTLVHVGSSSMRIFHRLTNARTGALVATLEQSGVHLDLDARRPSPLPPPLRERALAMVARAGS